MSAKTVEENKYLINFDKLRKIWGTYDYDKEHIKTLLERETNYRLPFHFQSPQLEYRATIIEWIKKVAVLKKLQNTTLHLAVYVLDNFMDNYDILPEKLHLAALVSLLLATKFEEQETNILKAGDLNELVQNKYTLKDYHCLEILVLKVVKWYLNYPTAVHFIYVYMEHIFSNEDFDSIENLYNKDFWHDVQSIINEYLDFVLTDIKLMHIKPSLVAATIIAVTRLSAGLSKIWPVRLAVATGYEFYELKITYFSVKQIDTRK